ncbi:phage tail protein [Vibrio sp. OCN044]|uniref:Phage tail protein n=1 Tax=Vibrio tetraodonis subsp. pristinus TaxID=2695891 RepID=A0A6L8M146_9VIBR|nr:phage tail protein [Vibrio tetraodonis]MYM61126.1 phage tail protein [Vibrio tetraodonis subsp. pristinus]
MANTSEITNLIRQTTKLTQAVLGKMTDIDNKVASAESDFQKFSQSVVDNTGFTAMNYNHDFLDTHELEANAHGHKNVYPIGMGINKLRNDCFKTEMIKVHYGANPESRDEEAKKLLDFMGIKRGTQYFSKSFNILKMTVLDTSFESIPKYDFYIPDRHVKLSPSATFMAYAKIKGTSKVSWLNVNKKDEWQRIREPRSTHNPGVYKHIDLDFTNASVGDVLYLALPTICTGYFPQSKKHGVLYSPKTELIRKINKLHPA